MTNSRPAGRLRWWIGTLLFLSTVINYIDRQTLSVLGADLKIEYQLDQLRFRAGSSSPSAWPTRSDRPVAGRFLDRRRHARRA